jgi:hypothetical protein
MYVSFLFSDGWTMDAQDIYTIAVSTHGYCIWLNIAGVINSPIYARYDSSGAAATGII